MLYCEEAKDGDGVGGGVGRSEGANEVLAVG
jgi:hypothetical protein